MAEVRLLHDVASVGAVGKRRAADNLLIRGDALNALTSLARLPEFARDYLGKVKLAYIDPPFNTQQSFLHYDDALEHSVWLTMMRDRIAQIWDLLAPTGSLWIHLDDSEMAYCRAMADELFGRNNFVATVVPRAVKYAEGARNRIRNDGVFTRSGERYPQADTVHVTTWASGAHRRQLVAPGPRRLVVMAPEQTVTDWITFGRCFTNPEEKV